MNKQDKKFFMKQISYPALFETDKKTGDVCASVPGLPGCFSCGKNFKEAQANLCEALELYVGVTLERSGFLPFAKKVRKKNTGTYKNISVRINFDITSHCKKIAYV